MSQQAETGSFVFTVLVLNNTLDLIISGYKMLVLAHIVYLLCCLSMLSSLSPHPSSESGSSDWRFLPGKRELFRPTVANCLLIEILLFLWFSFKH